MVRYLCARTWLGGVLALACSATSWLAPSGTPWAEAARRSLSGDAVRRSYFEPGFSVAQSDEELAGLYRANLDPDLAPWHGRSYRVANLLYMLKGLTRPGERSYFDGYLTVIIVRQGQVHHVPVFPGYLTNTSVWGKQRVMIFVNQLNRYARATNVFLPDTAFFFSLGDFPYGSRLRRDRLLHAPVFAIIKPWDWRRNVSADDGDDILLPHFHGWGDVPVGGHRGSSPGVGRSRALPPWHGERVFYPWERKVSKALMRATLQKGECRHRLHMHGKLLDVGATASNLTGFKVNLTDRVSMPDHARWRYLLSADGNSASSRLGKMLALDSVVLKQESAWIEHYYRSVVPYTHVVPFNATNVLEMIKGLQALPDGGRSIGAAGQRLVCRLASHLSSAAYVGRALRSYAALFPGDELGRLVRGLKLRDAGGEQEGQEAEGREQRGEGGRGGGVGAGGLGGSEHQWDDEVLPALVMEELLEQMEAFVTQQQETEDEERRGK